MWNKIYLIILAAAVLIGGVLTYFSYSWLKSIGSPVTVAQNYNYYSNLGSLFLWISTIILLVAANVILWKTGRAWALWTSLLYFAAFIVVQTFWLAQSFFGFKQENRLAESSFSFTPVYGAALIVLAAIIVFFNQFIVKRMREKMFTPAQPIDASAQDAAIDENAT